MYKLNIQIAAHSRIVLFIDCHLLPSPHSSQVAYAIGIAEPVSIHVDTYGTGTKTDDELLNIVVRNFDLRPGVIIR